jgi:hypothetical protein
VFSKLIFNSRNLNFAMKNYFLFTKSVSINKTKSFLVFQHEKYHIWQVMSYLALKILSSEIPKVLKTKFLIFLRKIICYSDFVDAKMSFSFLILTM